jgi:hypothetical protein
LTFFQKKDIREEDLIKNAKKTRKEVCKLVLVTNRQEGDIAGTKLKKFYKHLLLETGRYFTVEGNFEYDMKNSAIVYLIGKAKKEVVFIGPPTKMKESVKQFKKKNKNTYEKNGFVYSTKKVDFSLRKFVENWKLKNKDKTQQMGITDVIVN